MRNLLKDPVMKNFKDAPASSRVFDHFQTCEDILRRTSDPSLKLDTYSALMDHPIFLPPRRLQSQGISLRFDIQRGIADSRLSHGGHPLNEHVLGSFVKEILKKLFPRSPIGQQIPHDLHRQTIYIWIRDSADFFRSSILDENAWLDLNLLKAGNHDLIKVSHNDLCAKLARIFHQVLSAIEELILKQLHINNSQSPL